MKPMKLVDAARHTLWRTDLPDPAVMDEANLGDTVDAAGSTWVVVHRVTGGGRVMAVTLAELVYSNT